MIIPQSIENAFKGEYAHLQRSIKTNEQLIERLVDKVHQDMGAMDTLSKMYDRMVGTDTVVVVNLKIVKTPTVVVVDLKVVKTRKKRKKKRRKRDMLGPIRKVLAQESAALTAQDIASRTGRALAPTLKALSKAKLNSSGLDCTKSFGVRVTRSTFYGLDQWFENGVIRKENYPKSLTSSIKRIA